MNTVELLRYVADNLEAGRYAGHGLALCNQPCIAKSAGEIFFSQHHEYSLAPRTHVINGIEVPAPMDNEPKGGSMYWMECPGTEELFTECWWDYAAIDKLRLSRGLCYDSPEAAAANCKARYGIE